MYAIGVHNENMEFIETPAFTRLLTALLTDDVSKKDDLTDRETALLRELVKEL